jgi:hypothetical protein
MRRVSVVLIALAVLPVWLVGQTPAREASAPQGTPTGAGTIRGIVRTADGGRPLRLAHVVLIGAATGTLRVSETDADGSFAFERLPADRYVIGASKPPYLGAVAGARRPGRPGTSIALADGQTITDITVALPLGAAISGTIVDEAGRPGTGVAVGLQQWHLENGERVLGAGPASIVATDERGRYRIFGLLPGDYAVVALRLNGAPAVRELTDAEVDTALRNARAAPTPRADPAVRYAPEFFPGTTRASEAGLITLGAGEDRQGVDFRLELVRMARVEGLVTVADSQLLPGARVTIATAPGRALQTTMSAGVMPDGRFTLSNVLPGSYSLMAAGGGAQAGYAATATLDVEGTDQGGIQLTLRPPMALAGQLVFDGTLVAPALAGRRIPLRVLTPGVSNTTGPQVSETKADGSFVIARLAPGRYVLGGPLFFGANADSMIWSLESVIVDGRDFTDLPIEVTSEAPPKNVVVTYSDHVQQLSGRLQQPTGAAATDYTVVLFPEDKAYWLPGSRRILTVRPGTDGRFTFAGAGPLAVPPGRYLLAAVRDISRDEQFDPSFLSALVPTAAALTIQAGESKTQDLRIK